MTIGEKIKRLRKEYGMTQEELGNTIGVQKAAINKYETGVVVNLKKNVIQKLANALRVNPVWLMDEDAGWPPVPSTQPILTNAPDETIPQTSEARIISGGIDKMPKERREQALKILQVAFAEYADYFKEDHDDET